MELRAVVFSEELKTKDKHMILDRPFMTQRPGPVVLCILDGVGYASNSEGDTVLLLI